MDFKDHNKDNFWNFHGLSDFQRITLIKDIHSSEITSVCFLKDGRLVSGSMDQNAFIYNKITFEIEIKIKEKKPISYINITKEGILIICLYTTFFNLYKIKEKEYEIIQTIKPYSLLMEIQAKFEDCFSIRKFIELKNGDLAVIVWRFGISFYTKKKKKKSKYSLLKKYRENKEVIISDLFELDNNKFIISLKEHEKIQFLDMNFSKLTKTMKLDKFCIGSSKNELILMNDIDLFVVGEMGIIIIDIQKKEIIDGCN